MLSALLIASVALQVRVGATVTHDTAKKNVDVNVSVGGNANEGRRPPKRVPVTDEHLRTAFKTVQARSILTRARVARMSQDSALLSYDATAYLRISAGIGFSKIGRDRLAFRHENTTQVKWHRDVGAWIEVKGARTAIPMALEHDEEEEAADIINDSDMTPVPYYPGQEPLFSFNGSGTVKAQVDERDMVHPLAEGAEAYYTYAVGDSVTFRLPDGKTIELRELHVRPRQAKWNVAVGSLWFDVATGQLVRAAYRLAVPMDIWSIVEEEDRLVANSTTKDDIPVWVKPIISPMRAQISSIAVEYGLFQGRFWLPRMRSAEGDAQVSFMRVPFKFQQSFRFTSVNATDSLPKIRVATIAQPPDSLSDAEREKWRDSVREVRRERRRAQRDSINKGLIVDPLACDSTGMRLVQGTRQDSNMPVAMRVPCDIKVLYNSPELPKSIYDEGEEVFGSKEADALIAEALAMGAQPPFALPFTMAAQKPTIKYGLNYTRFNRVEGLSSALYVEQKLGAGYTASALGRLGHADLEPNFELALERSNLSKTIRGRVYNRLVASNDWGNPLSFGSSLSALLFGRDEGFYYRASGAEVEWVKERGALFTWKFFAERQRAAAAENTFSLGAPFIANIAARTGQYAGFAGRVFHTYGLNPNGFRVFTDARVEAAATDSSGEAYGRGALELTFSDSFGDFASALTLSSGSTFGPAPMQRHFFLGGAHTVRGQRADTAQSGNAYWLGRLEVGRRLNGVRPVLFGDIGWTGDRTQLRDVGRPLSGAGVGMSMMDGLIRFDVSKGIYPAKRVRVDLYVEAKF